MGLVSHFKYLIGLSSLIPLLPLIVFQGKQVKANTLRLPCAKGNTYASHSLADVSLLHLGESTVAGVGVKTLDQGLTQAIVKQLQHASSLTIDWHIQAKNGASLHQLNELDVTIQNPDLLVITIGVNDTTGLTSRADWRKQLNLCVQRFAGPDTHVFFTKVPNMAHFPALPAPLSWFLGCRSQILDHELKTLCRHSNWHHIKTSLPIEEKWMAKDGYHPNKVGYQIWGKQIGQAILKTLGIPDS
ncbi:hypothetical protein A9Q77_03520 [Marinomonas sp. 42_23_T18]|nr:hypothetical protein A9Q77_03520 [Marinomonas sp. 42_23_T18]